MSDKIAKIVQWFLYGLLIISALLGILFYADVVSVDLLLNWGYVLLVLIIAATLITAVMGLVRNPRGSLKFLTMFAVVVVVGIISYALSTNDYSVTELEKLKITASTSRMVGAGLYLTYFLGIVAILSIIYATVSRIFK